MIYDCFPFFKELELLELRLNELAGVVDKFVLVEATRTFSNKPKPLHYQENRAKFSAFHDKIIHVIVQDMPPSSDAWILDNFQRNCIVRGLTNCRPDDFVLVSDLDEIPRATTVKKASGEIPFHRDMISNAVHATLNSRAVKSIFHRRVFRPLLRNNHPFVYKFEQTLYRHYLNCQVVEPRCWPGTRMLRFRDYSCAEELRYSGYKVVKDGGWHFTSMGGVERIREKVAAFAHQEYNKPEFIDPLVVEERINQGKPLFGQDEQLKFVPLDQSFPGYILEHPEKFSSWIKPVP